MHYFRVRENILYAEALINHLKCMTGSPKARLSALGESTEGQA